MLVQDVSVLDCVTSFSGFLSGFLSPINLFPFVPDLHIGCLLLAGPQMEVSVLIELLLFSVSFLAN